MPLIKIGQQVATKHQTPAIHCSNICHSRNPSFDLCIVQKRPFDRKNGIRIIVAIRKQSPTIFGCFVVSALNRMHEFRPPNGQCMVPIEYCSMVNCSWALRFSYAKQFIICEKLWSTLQISKDCKCEIENVVPLLSTDESSRQTNHVRLCIWVAI